MQGNTAVGGREGDDIADQWLKEDRECDSGSELQVVRNSKKKGRSMLWKSTCPDPATLNLRECTHHGSIPASLPSASASSVSLGVHSQMFPTSDLTGDSSAGLGWVLLRNSRHEWARTKSGHCSETAVDETRESHSNSHLGRRCAC